MTQPFSFPASAEIDTDLVLARIRSIVGADDRTVRRGAGRAVALAAVAASLATAVLVGVHRPANKVAPAPRAIIIPERGRPSPAPAVAPVPAIVAAPMAVTSPVRPATAVASTPARRPRVYYAHVPRLDPHPAKVRSEVAHAAPAPRAPPAVDGGNGAVAVHLTGEALRVALEKDAALTRKLNQAELRRVGAGRPSDS